MTVYEFDVAIPSYLCNKHDRLRLGAAAGLLQEAAWQHARVLGATLVDAEDPGYWVLRTLSWRIDRMPRWDQTVRIRTWPSVIAKLQVHREYQIEAADGAALGCATAAWVIVDRAGKPLRPECVLPSGFPLPQQRALEPGKRVRAIGAEVYRDLLRAAVAHRVRPSEVDRNEHVNNTQYLQWIGDWAEESATGGRTYQYVASLKLGWSYKVLRDRAVTEVWGIPEGAEPFVAFRAGPLER